MLSVQQARELILSDIRALTAERIGWDAIPTAIGRVLAEDIAAHEDIPGFANSSMDGFAVRSADVAGAGAESGIALKVIGEIPAGAAPTFTLTPGTAAWIMTGAMLPDGADSIVPVEDTDANMKAGSPDTVQIMKAARLGAYVRPVGEDMRTGQVILKQGRALRPGDIGVLASIGVTGIQVVRLPKVAILSTGDELVSPGSPIQPGQIRDANGAALSAAVQALGAQPIWLGIARDTESSVRDAFQNAVGCDLILSSAGVSVGAYDVVKAVIEQMGAVNFWKVNMRPGKPLTFGRISDIPYLGLPGNPVSSLVTFELFARPLLLKMMGKPTEPTLIDVVCGEAFDSDGRESYLRVRITRSADQALPIATSTGTQSSGALSSLVFADALLIVPSGTMRVEAGEVLKAYSLN